MEVIAESAFDGVIFNPKVVFTLETLANQANIFGAGNSNNLSSLLEIAVRVSF